MNVFSIRAGLVALALGVSSTTYAATVVSNLPNQVSGTNMSYAQVADNFTLGFDINLTDIRFWSVQSDVSDYSGTVFWAIHSNAAGSPGVVVFSGTAAPVATPTGLSTGFGYAEYTFDFAAAGLLTAGDYWLSLQNSALGSTIETEMLWETSSGGTAPTGQYVDFTSNLGWIDSGNEHAFQIFGDRVVVEPPSVPEPTTIALLLGALLAAGTVRRQTRKV